MKRQEIESFMKSIVRKYLENDQQLAQRRDEKIRTELVGDTSPRKDNGTYRPQVTTFQELRAKELQQQKPKVVNKEDWLEIQRRRELAQFERYDVYKRVQTLMRYEEEAFQRQLALELDPITSPMPPAHLVRMSAAYHREQQGKNDPFGATMEQFDLFMPKNQIDRYARKSESLNKKSITKEVGELRLPLA